MATPTYRDRVRAPQIDASVLDTGASSAASALANTLKDFERAGRQTLGELRQEQGRREGAEAGRTDDPAFRSGMSSLTAYGRAYNDAATRSYAIKSEIAADEAATRLELEAGNDPDMFRATFGAWRDQTIKTAPAEARAVLGEVYDRRMAAGMQRIIQAQALEQKNQDRADAAEGVVRATDRIAQLRASNDPALHAQAEEEQIKLDMLFEGAQRDGTFSAVEAGAMRYEADKSVLAQTVVQRFRNEFDNPYGDPIGFIENLREVNKTSEALAPDEEAKLMDSLLGELRERNSLAAAKKAMEGTEQAKIWAANENIATNLMLDGQLTNSTLSKMLDDDALDPAIARTLYNELTSGDTPKSDPQTLFSAEIGLLSMSEEDIRTERGLTWVDRSRLILKRREWESGWRGTQEGREAADRIDRALGIPPGLEGKLLSGPEKVKRERALTAWYNAVDALPPAERQANLIPLSEEVISKVIKDTNYDKLQKKRLQRAAIEKEYAAKGDLSKAEAKARDEDLAAIDQQIQRLEQAAK